MFIIEDAIEGLSDALAVEAAGGLLLWGGGIDMRIPPPH
jgi:hypothetical protein